MALILLVANHHNSTMKAVEHKVLVTKLFHMLSYSLTGEKFSVAAMVGMLWARFSILSRED